MIQNNAGARINGDFQLLLKDKKKTPMYWLILKKTPKTNEQTKNQTKKTSKFP